MCPIGRRGRFDRPRARPVPGRRRSVTIGSVSSDEHGDEALLDNLSQPVELERLEVHASGAIHLNHEWVAYLDEAHLPVHVAGVDDGLHHGVAEDGTAYA